MASTPLRERMRQALRIRNMSPRTERIYLDSVARFALYFHLSPDRLGLPEIERYLLFLRDVKKVSYCWFNQCVCALRFFYLGSRGSVLRSLASGVVERANNWWVNATARVSHRKCLSLSRLQAAKDQRSGPLPLIPGRCVVAVSWAART